MSDQISARIVMNIANYVHVHLHHYECISYMICMLFLTPNGINVYVFITPFLFNVVSDTHLKWIIHHSKLIRSYLVPLVAWIDFNHLSLQFSCRIFLH